MKAAKLAGPATLAAGGALLFVALFFGDGPSDGRLFWIGAFAVLAVVALGSSLPVPGRAGVVCLGLLVALAAWVGLSMAWSIAPDRSWASFDRILVYCAFAALGLLATRVPRPARTVAGGLALLLGLVLGWALLGKVIPSLFPDGARVARLRNPIGYWNSLALAAATAVPLGLWLVSRRHRAATRVGGAVLIYLAELVVVLTLSRAGIAVAAIAAFAWLALERDRLESYMSLSFTTPIAALVLGFAFWRPGVTNDLQSYSDRVNDGAWFGLVAFFGLLVVVLAAFWVARIEIPGDVRLRLTRIAGRGFAAAALAAVAIVLILKGGAVLDEFRGTGGKEVSQSPTRLAELSSSNRWRWWQESWTLWKDAPLAGKGAGTFEIARRDIRVGAITTIEPHNLALQFLSETGIVGFLLFLGFVGTAIAAAVAALRRLEPPERAAAAALAVGLGAYVVHALVDIDWEFAAVTAPAVFVLGALLGLGSVRRVGVPIPAAAGVAIAILYSLVAPYASSRLVDSAYSELAADRTPAALSDGRAARWLNPLSTDPLQALGDAEAAVNAQDSAIRWYGRAVSLQPENSSTWYARGSYEFFVGRYKLALHDLDRAYGLDPYGPAGRPGGLLDQARAKVLGTS